MKQVIIFALVFALEGVWVTAVAKAGEPNLKNWSVAPASSFRNWRDWYPVNFGQTEGFRMINRWDSITNANQLIHGQSSLNVPNNIGTLPAIYNGRSIDYFYFFACRAIGDIRDPNCYNQQFDLEIISQGSAYDPVGQTTLEHWARGGDYYGTNNVIWQVYYDPGLVPTCDGSILKNSNLDLRDERLKKPWTLKLPVGANQYYLSDPVCAIVFNGYDQDKNRIIDSRGSIPGNGPWETGNWISATITDEVFTDSSGRDIVRAENIYYTDNARPSARFNTSYCESHADSLRCPNGAPDEKIVNGHTYRAFAFEEYYMRKTETSGKYGPNVKDKYGFGSFSWAGGVSDWDRMDNNGVINNYNDAENQQYQRQKCSIDANNEISSCYEVKYEDVNQDGVVDGKDIKLVLNQWQATSCTNGYVCDFNNDLKLNSFDIARIISGR